MHLNAVSSQCTRDDFKLRLIKRPFLLIRLIIFLLLGFLNIIIAVLSVWGIVVSRVLTSDWFTGSLFTLVNSCLFLILATIATADTVFPCTTTSKVKFEVAWTGILSVFYLAAGIMVTRDGLLLVRQPGVSDIITTLSILLILVSWFALIFIVSYFIILLVLMIIHIPIYPNVYDVPVIFVPWFHIYLDPPIKNDKLPFHHKIKPSLDTLATQDDSHGKVDIEQPHQKIATICAPFPPPAEKEEVGRARNDSHHTTQSLASSVASITPQWAKDLNAKTKRGITHPFQHPIEQVRLDDRLAGHTQIGKKNQKSVDSSDDSEPPTLPQNVRVCDRVGERLFEVDRDRRATAILPSLHAPSQLSRALSATSREEKRMGALHGKGGSRQSVSSLFPCSVKEEEWNQPLKKPPFKNGHGEGWRTADNMKRGDRD